MALSFLSDQPRIDLGAHNPLVVVENTSLTVTCDTDANPPVTSYQWKRGNDVIGECDVTQNLSTATCVCVMKLRQMSCAVVRCLSLKIFFNLKSSIIAHLVGGEELS